ncbi:thiamine-phosphate kinase [Parahaliea maris]|uniref:Thiamine-monophosphate kinase n=1 Tax=Parahaliea maris TaxID=2716870 RepID=A0A5C9ABJ5_9GAMM|nr:thiamine-phosphate kinase [Parahaliea maris]TXS96701.1 thiamine-phosphate kinase [Parahaliea maris]
MPLSEFDLIYQFFSSLGRGPGVVLGVGDDCALLQVPEGEQLATSMDTVVAGVHFPEDGFPEDIGFRAIAAAASDLAAMGARPLGMTLALTVPEADDLWLRTCSEGVAAAVSAFDLPLVGGDTTRGPLSITVQVFGSVPAGKALLRSGAQVGDQLCVSGTQGDAAAALLVLSGDWPGSHEAAEYLEQRYYRPSARLALGQSLLGVATSAIDISDGLLADAGHIAAASGVKLKIDPALLPLSPALRSYPDQDQALRWALAGGDDYELCFTLPAEAELPPLCTRIGEVVAGEGVDCGLDPGDAGGYRHF